MIMALYKVKSDAIPQAYAVEITKAIPIRGPKLNKYPNFTESMHLILCLATVAFWELTRQDCSVRDGALTIYISVAGLYAIDYYSGFDRRPGDPNERCLYLPRFILYLCTGVLYMIRNETSYGCQEWDVALGILSILYSVLSFKHFWLSTINGIVIAQPPPMNPYPRERRKIFAKGQSSVIVPTGNPKNKV